MQGMNLVVGTESEAVEEQYSLPYFPWMAHAAFYTGPPAQGSCTQMSTG